MPIPRGVKDRNGYLVKALPSGEPWPLDSGLAPLFRAAHVKTLPDALKYGVNICPDKECMASRQLLGRVRENHEGKSLEKLRLGEYHWKTYSEVLRDSQAVGSYLSKLNFGFGNKIAIFAETRPEWFISAFGALQQRISVCTIYTTLNDAGIQHALSETEVSLVITSFDLFPRLCRILNQCPKISKVIVMEDQLEGIGSTASVPNSVEIIPFSTASAIKNINSAALKVKPLPEDIAIIMYTSGSTGTPKGVELTHTNILTAVIGYSVQMNVGKSDRYLAFLPLAHIMELATEVALIALGVTIYYSSPHTLTSNSPKIQAGTFGDAKVAKPTVMNVVPLLLDRIIKGVTQAVDSHGWLKSTIFHSCVAYKPWLDYLPLGSTILDWLVFNKVKEELGGRLKRIVSGGAPLSPQTHNTFKSIFGCTIQVGYGSTETASCATGMNEDDYTTGHCGSPCLNVLLKLDDWEEGGYTTADTPRPRGEIVIGGICVSNGYFKNAEETKRAFYEENGIRWFKTGDIAEIDESGSIHIIDRKKDLVKLKHGEYIALGNAETILKTMTVIDNMCIFADSSKICTVAVIVPVLDVLRKIAAGVGVTDPTLTLEELCEKEEVNTAILNEVKSHGKRCGLSRWEIPAAVHLSPTLWTPDTGLVTAALKLRRTELNNQYRKMVTAMYSRLNDQ